LTIALLHLRFTMAFALRLYESCAVFLAMTLHFCLVFLAMALHFCHGVWESRFVRLLAVWSWSTAVVGCATWTTACRAGHYRCPRRVLPVMRRSRSALPVHVHVLPCVVVRCVRLSVLTLVPPVHAVWEDSLSWEELEFSGMT